ncbi:hypothetical protein CN138_27315 [Sinorhizobium meliloti]|uniref:Uncharacterized protein n=1 Tax=Rhizobium meliloti (strain 1021) TaxID=266834 RepID=Q92ZE6_RHIME|nr:hypothetical protein SMa1002 [Sinorhizobium meliloti 1021]AGG70223.1 Hypothetical protein SM2011_a1002 [Sinorhizobium meliloti 2011]ASP60383.1 hypothetical protein CDO30_18750 [Sinorhizobium meliloti]RVE86480.1 hypothetical protein CN235_29185 [Sinorhizobium meliloti]RVG05368.1 hypothetical protein CN234_25140 [Sinorhizobium meliloti]
MDKSTVGDSSRPCIMYPEVKSWCRRGSRPVVHDARREPLPLVSTIGRKSPDCTSWRGRVVANDESRHSSWLAAMTAFHPLEKFSAHAAARIVGGVFQPRRRSRHKAAAASISERSSRRQPAPAR